MIKNYLFLFLFVFSASILHAQPPEPTLGKRWILNEKFSDEFNGTELDLTKWYNYHPKWVGRPPGIFLPSQVSVANGYMSIRGEKMENDTVVTFWDGSKSTFNIACGAVVSRTQDASFGYYECRFKAGKTTLSTTFWMSTRGGGIPGPAGCGDKYGQELDIQECIGREGDFDGSWFAKGMHSNTHIHYTDCEGVKHDLRGNQVTFESEELESDAFNTYGGWWKNENEAIVYYNNGEGRKLKVYSTLMDKPFNRAMGVNLVSETYPFPWISLPTDEELADTNKNICYYDWVRAYTLVDVDYEDQGETLVKDGGFETGSFFAYWTGWGGNPREVVSNNQYSGDYCAHIVGEGAPEQEVYLKRNTDYTLSCYGKVVTGTLILGIKDAADTWLGSVNFTDTEYENKSVDFNTGSSTICKLFYYAQTAGDEGYADDFVLVERDPVGDSLNKTVMFNEKIYFSDTPNEKTARQSLDFLITYMANTDREINLHLYNSGGALIGEEKYTALGGFGKKQYIMQLDSIPTAGNNYKLIADIRPTDSSFVDTFQTVTYQFDLLEPVNVELTVLDIRNDSVLPGALVTIADTTKTTNQDGEVNFFSVSPGTMPVQIEKEGYVAYSSDTNTVRNDTSLNIRLTPVSYWLTMYISDEYTGKALEGASISIDGKNSLTNYEGKAMQLHYAGNYRADMSLERYADKSVSINIIGDTVVYVGLDLQLADAKFVILKDSSSLAGADVSIDGKSEVTSSVGLVKFNDLKTDTAYVYSVEYLSTILAEDTLVLLADTTVRLNFNTPVNTGLTLDNSLQVYPNPASTHIRVTGFEENLEYNILDINGRILLSGIAKSEEIILVSKLETGIYYMKLGFFPMLKFTLIK